MPARRLTDTHLVVATGIVTVVLASVASVIQPPGDAGAGPASSFSAGAGGGKAAFLTLLRLGHDVERSYEPLASLRVDPTRTTLVVTGSIAASEQDRRALQEFVERGGIVLLAGTQGADFLNVPAGAPPHPLARPSRHRALSPSPLARGATEITMVPLSRPPAFGPSFVNVFAVAGDQPLVATARRGTGRIVWLAASTPLANAHIPEAANLQLLLNIVGAPGERRILWDEHYHGHSRSMWSYAAGTPLPWLGAQAGVMMIALFAAYSRRSGPVRSRAVASRTSPLEFIDMLRELYRRAGARGAAVRAARTRLHRVATAVCGVPVDGSPEVLASAVAAKSGLSRNDVLDVLTRANSASTADSDDGEALKLTQDLQRLTNAVARRIA